MSEERPKAAGADRSADSAAAQPEAALAAAPAAWNSRRAWVLLIAVVLVGLGLDLSSKSAAFRMIGDEPARLDRSVVVSLPPDQINLLVPRDASMVVIPKLLNFELVLNPGAVFGVGPGRRWFFIAFTAAALTFGLWVFARWTRANQKWAHVAIGCVIAGGLGNLYDRVVYGCVRDFIHPLPGVPLPFGLKWPSGSPMVWPWVSNVADALLLFGIGVLVVTLWRSPAGDEIEAAKAESAGA
ncbi:MAG: signal peptidase II [Planctomycetota bacterium]|nr:signal peptidase II [Planctomycetota bacterium]